MIAHNLSNDAECHAVEPGRFDVTGLNLCATIVADGQVVITNAIMILYQNVVGQINSLGHANDSFRHQNPEAPKGLRLAGGDAMIRLPSISTVQPSTAQPIILLSLLYPQRPAGVA